MIEILPLDPQLLTVRLQGTCWRFSGDLTPAGQGSTVEMRPEQGAHDGAVLVLAGIRDYRLRDGFQKETRDAEGLVAEIELDRSRGGFMGLARVKGRVRRAREWVMGGPG